MTPTHEYRSERCGHVYERTRSVNPETETCDECLEDGRGELDIPIATRQFPSSAPASVVKGGTPIHHARAPRR
jgi:hypothetical protein